MRRCAMLSTAAVFRSKIIEDYGAAVESMPPNFVQYLRSRL
jgi:hypothetical protein